MSAARPQVSAGRVGRAHGLDGSFYLDDPNAELTEGTAVTIAGHAAVVERRTGTAARPLLRVSGIGDRDSIAALRGQDLIVEGGALEEGEYLVDDLVGCEVPGLGAVRRVIAAPSCDLLEVGDAELLVPFVSDAIERVDLAARVIEVDLEFLDLDGAAGEEPAEPA